MRYSSLSEKGRRPNNEDVVFTRFDPRYPLIAAVSDGMGGHAAGEVASRISIEALDMWTRELVDAPQNVLVDAFFNANAQVISAAEEDHKLSGMGATLVAAIFYHDHFITANIGDSRLYLVSSGEIRQPPFLLNTRNRTLEKDGQRIKLTQVEYSIMKVFMENPGKALSREEILDMVWGRDYFGELKIVDVNIRRLRLKIEDNVQNPTYITTVWGYGYKWGF